MKKKKSNKLNLIICAIAFVFMISYVYFVDGFDNLVNSIQSDGSYDSILAAGGTWSSCGTEGYIP